MRDHVIAAVTELAETDSRIILVNGDLGYNVLNRFEDRFPERYLNVGIAEQNMTSVAAGLALEGNVVFTYSIGNFPTLRCMEQIRNDVCYHRANVKILAVGGGFAYGDLGMSHHATEDIAMMRALPNMRVYVPADTIEAVACLRDAYQHDGPAYIRMARGREPDQHSAGAQVDITKIIPLRETPGDVAILSTGTILSEAILLQRDLQASGIDAALYSCPCVKPLDAEGIRRLARSHRLLVTMEDHNIIGGFGGAVAEVLSELPGSRAALLRIGLPDTYTEIVGSQDYLREQYGLSAGRVKPRILKELGVEA